MIAYRTISLSEMDSQLAVALDILLAARPDVDVSAHELHVYPDFSNGILLEDPRCWGKIMHSPECDCARAYSSNSWAFVNR